MNYVPCLHQWGKGRWGITVKQRNITITRTFLFALNLMVISFMSAVIYMTTELICSSDKAREFLERIRYIPTTPWKVPVFSVLLLVLMIASIFLREKIFRDKPLAMYAFCLLDIAICIFIMYFLNMGYKGILLLAIANIVIYIEGKKRKYLFLIFSILVYILFDYDIFSIKLNMFSINDYMEYYTSSQRLYIFSIRNILTSLNEMVFIVFMIFVIQGQIDENTKIKELYDRLFKTAEELQIANIQLEEYTKKSEEMAKTRERNRLAREIHDTIGHTLTGIATGLEACTELIGMDMDKTKVQLGKITELARKGLLDIRRSVQQLRPDALERFSLIPALQKLADDINGCTNTRVLLEIEGKQSGMNADEEETVYRVVQESITNSVRHGNAKEIHIQLKFENFRLKLKISDDGIGCESINDGFGLRHIRERVEMLGGLVEFSSRGERGFATNVEIPIRWG